MRKTNSRRITAKGKERINYLLNSFMIHRQQKTLLKGILDRSNKKNLSISDIEIFNTISDQYRGC